MFLPEYSTIDEACNWLSDQTNDDWCLARLIENHLTPYIWLDYDPQFPGIYGNHPEGIPVKMIYQGDISRLRIDRTCTLTMYLNHDGSLLIKSVPSGNVPLSELLFKREDVQELAVQTAPAKTTTPTAPETKEQRQARRLKACEAAGLVMPRSSVGRLPYGVGDVADTEGVTRQAFSTDVKAALERRESANKEGVTTHRA